MAAKNFSNGWLVVVGILLLAGCGGDDGGDLPATVDASGVVLLDGQPVHGASIVFSPKEGNYPAFAITDSSGRFDLKAFEAKDGAVPGSYAVQVSKTIEVSGDKAKALANLGQDAAHAAQDPKAGVSWKNALPEKYASPATSGISVDIPTQGRTDIKIDLVSK